MAANPPRSAADLGKLTLVFKSGGREEIWVTREDHDRALAAMNSGEAVQLTAYSMGATNLGVYDVAAGVLSAMQYH